MKMRLVRLWFKYFLQLMGMMYVAVLIHEMYHWTLAQNPIDLCFSIDGAYVRMVDGGGSEWAAYSIFVVVTILAFMVIVYKEEE